MRMLLAAFTLAAFVCQIAAPPAFAQDQGCTGENCPPPAGNGGQDCEREKKEDQTA